MIRLIQAEQLKMYTRPFVWIAMIILLIVIVISALLNVSKLKDVEDLDWKMALIEENRSLALDVSMAPVDVKPMFQSQIERNEYFLELKVSPDGMTAWKFVNLVSNFLPLVTLFSLIVASDVVAGEYQWGTLKLLLIRPVSRMQVLLSKYISSLLYAGVLLIMMLLFSWIVGAVLFGISGMSDPYVFTRDNQHFEHIPMINRILLVYALKIITLVVIVTIAFVISVLFKNGSIAIACSVFILFGGNIAANLLNHVNADITKYFLFTHLNLDRYLTDTPPIEGVTIMSSLSILLAYLLILYLIAWGVFSRKNVS